MEPSTKAAYRQIRANYNDETITVYQAYSEGIATAAVKHQKLNASPAFSMTRMTWIKPSWAWMLYRSGYSYKDNRQAHILALELKHETFKNLLRKAVLSHGPEMEQAKEEGRGKGVSVRVQWDPERDVRMNKLEYRSIQIGVSGALVKEFVDGIVGVEDVTERARELKKVLDEDGEGNIGLQELVTRGLVPVEREFELDEKLREVLGMNFAGAEKRAGASHSGAEGYNNSNDPASKT